MGQLHNELRRTFLTTAITKALGITKGGGIERFGETLTPTINLWELPEWAFLRAEGLFARYATAAAVAAEFSGVALMNPANSGKIVVVDTIDGGTIAGGLVTLALVSEAALSAATYTNANVVARDTRWPSQILQVPQFWFGSAPGALNGTVIDRVASGAANQMHPFRTAPYVLTPGFGINAECTVVNQAIFVAYSGRARNAFPGEF